MKIPARLHSIAKTIADHGGQALLVGGAVRDILMGRIRYLVFSDGFNKLFSHVSDFEEHKNVAPL